MPTHRTNRDAAAAAFAKAVEEACKKGRHIRFGGHCTHRPSVAR